MLEYMMNVDRKIFKETRGPKRRRGTRKFGGYMRTLKDKTSMIFLEVMAQEESKKD